VSEQNRRRRLALIAAAAVVAAATVIALILLVWPTHHPADKAPTAQVPSKGVSVSSASASPSPSLAPTFAQVPGGPVPASAAAVARQLVTGTPDQQRAALTAAAAAALSGSGPLFPVGSSLTLDSDGWRQDGDFANATGVLADPSGKQTRAEIGFMADPDHPGAWKVTFEEASP
jgi:hypothetical protein